MIIDGLFYSNFSLHLSRLLVLYNNLVKILLLLFVYILEIITNHFIQQIMKELLLLTIALLFAQVTFAQKIDTEASKIEFEVSNMGKIVKGTLLNLKGTVNFDANNLDASSFDATVDPATVDTKSKGRDKHLQKDDFFGVATYPTVKVRSNKITKTETGYEAAATLTIRDISTDLTIPFTIEKEGEQQHLMGTFLIQRKEYGLGDKMGAGSIGLEVTVHIDCFVNLK